MISLRASAIGGCPRALVFQAMGYEGEPRDLQSRLTLRLGAVMETVILEELGYQVEDAQVELIIPVNKYVQIVGHPDGRVDKTLLEVKTMSNFAYQQVRKYGIKDYYPQYFSQGSCYLIGKHCNLLRFICFNKDRSTIFEQDYPRSEVEPHFKQAAQRARQVALWVKAGVMPERPQDLPAWRCKKRYCEYRHCELNEGHKIISARRAA